jgi:hypothetical protein
MRRPQAEGVEKRVLRKREDITGRSQKLNNKEMHDL